MQDLKDILLEKLLINKNSKSKNPFEMDIDNNINFTSKEIEEIIEYAKTLKILPKKISNRYSSNSFYLLGRIILAYDNARIIIYKNDNDYEASFYDSEKIHHFDLIKTKKLSELFNIINKKLKEADFFNKI